jgi:hypothetical protein
MDYEFWYDSHHTGAIRVVDRRMSFIYGSDPGEEAWRVAFIVTSRDTILVDFSTKETHRGATQMIAIYEKQRNELHWPDRNVWLRMRVDPRKLLGRL